MVMRRSEKVTLAPIVALVGVEGGWRRKENHVCVRHKEARRDEWLYWMAVAWRRGKWGGQARKKVDGGVLALLRREQCDVGVVSDADAGRFLLPAMRATLLMPNRGAEEHEQRQAP